MAKALVITSYAEHIDKLRTDFSSFDKVICADGGYLIAGKLGLKPDFFIGDYDSSPVPDASNAKVLPCEKDMTDTEAAIEAAVNSGADEVTILGGLGGRFDHTMGNIGMLCRYTEKGLKISMEDGQNYVFMLAPGSYEIPANSFRYMGIISYSPVTKGIRLGGTKYPLDGYDLTYDTSLGVSNEIISDKASISFDEGLLLMIFSDDVR